MSVSSHITKRLTYTHKLSAHNWYGMVPHNHPTTKPALLLCLMRREQQRRASIIHHPSRVTRKHSLLYWLGQSISFSIRYNMPLSTKSCPCCSFEALNENLFLPASLAMAEQQQQPPVTTREEHNAPEGGDLLPDVASVYHEIVPEVIDDKKEGSSTISLVDTHCHAHLEREPEQVYHLFQQHGNRKNDDETKKIKANQHFVSVTCTVAPDDWQDCIEYAGKSPLRLAALGVHPWYLADLDDRWLQDLETLLQQHEGVMVGEIGLCKVARFVRTYEHGKAAALALQRNVFVQQLDLAAAYQRPVTIHCVNQQQILLDTFKARSSLEQLPPVIGLHSFTGTAHHIDQLLKWEATLRPKKLQGEEEAQDKEDPLLYFGFSHMVNYAMCSSEKSRKQGRDAIRRVPPDRLLAESDVHHSDDSLGGTALAVAYLAWALEESVSVVAQRTTANALRFLQSIRKATTERKGPQ